MRADAYAEVDVEVEADESLEGCSSIGFDVGSELDPGERGFLRARGMGFSPLNAEASKVMNCR